MPASNCFHSSKTFVPDDQEIVARRGLAILGGVDLFVGAIDAHAQDAHQHATTVGNFLKRRSPAIPHALGAQMVGRWPDGAPLVKYPDGPEQFASVGSSINDFRYQRDDPFGRRCPIGAHIRRANPREGRGR